MSGYNLPPGVSLRDIDPPEQPCAVCGFGTDNCICPECPKCQTYGDPVCYEEHGLRRTDAQRIGFTKMQIAELKERIAEHEQYLQLLEDKAVINKVVIRGRLY